MKLNSKNTKKLVIILILVFLSGYTFVNKHKIEDEQTNTLTVVTSDEVDYCDTSGITNGNTIVDIGVDTDNVSRNYYSSTNEFGQVYQVIASDLFLQTDDIEDVNSKGRYCDDEANVPGTELSNFDEGHIIADSLGGSSNAYNIVPQESNLNRYGTQAVMEEEIRQALANGSSVTNFKAELSYPNATTRTPNHYKYTFEIDGVFIIYEFDNL